MLSQTTKYSMKPWKMSLLTAYFNTHDYNSRVYIYEQSTPYNMSFPSFFGHGLHAVLLVSRNLGKHFEAYAKCGLTHYFDRNEIGTALQRIGSSTQTDLDIALRWRI